jgi:hypothetical protein
MLILPALRPSVEPMRVPRYGAAANAGARRSRDGVRVSGAVEGEPVVFLFQISRSASCSYSALLWMAVLAEPVLWSICRVSESLISPAVVTLCHIYNEAVRESSLFFQLTVRDLGWYSVNQLVEQLRDVHRNVVLVGPEGEVDGLGECPYRYNCWLR